MKYYLTAVLTSWLIVGGLLCALIAVRAPGAYGAFPFYLAFVMAGGTVPALVCALGDSGLKSRIAVCSDERRHDEVSRRSGISRFPERIPVPYFIRPIFDYWNRMAGSGDHRCHRRDQRRDTLPNQSTRRIPVKGIFYLLIVSF